MPAFTGVNHLALTVSDVEASTRFYTEVLGFRKVLEFDGGCVCLDAVTAFSLALLRPEGATGGRFTELTTGLDHVGLAAGSRAELEEWSARFDELGVTYTPIRDMALGHHLNFRDPDGIALEFYVPNERYLGALEELRTGALSDEEVRARAEQLVTEQTEQ